MKKKKIRFTKYGNKLKSGNDYFVLNKQESKNDKLVFRKDNRNKTKVHWSTRFYVHFETEIWLLLCALLIIAAYDNACVLCANQEDKTDMLEICSVVQYRESLEGNLSNMPNLIPTINWDNENSSDAYDYSNKKP